MSAEDGSVIWDWLVFRQDYGWFLVAMGWLVLSAGWLRLANGRLPWFPAAALGGIATAAVELAHLVTPVGTPAGKPQWLPGDLALGGIYALVAAFWWWRRLDSRLGFWSRIGLILVEAGVIGAAAYRAIDPILGGIVVVAALAISGFLFGWAASRWERLALAGFVLSVACSTNGPLAEILHLPHRFVDIHPLGPLEVAAAGVALVASAKVMGSWLAPMSPSPIAAAEARTNDRLVRSLVVWIVLGLLMAEAMGTWERRVFEANLLARVKMSRELLDPTLLSSALGPKFGIAKTFTYKQDGRAERLGGRLNNDGERSARQLLDPMWAIDRANPDADYAMIVVMRQGWIVNLCPMPNIPGSLRNVGLAHRIEASDLLRWADRSSSVTGPIRTYYGSTVEARVPLKGPTGLMLGWLVLDFPISEWYSAQLRARLLAFTVVALGGCVLFFDWRQRQRELQRRAAELAAAAAAAASRLKTNFLANVSHEFRAPLQTISGYSELLRPVLPDAKARTWLAAISAHAELMGRLVNDLVDLAALESGSFTMKPGIVGVADVVSEITSGFRERAEAKGITLALFIGTGIPPWVEIDRERLKQVALNLIGNAVKFTDRGGVSVGVAGRPMTGNGLRDEQRHCLLSLTVQDTGPGIPAAEQSRLFTAFSRLEATAEKEGTGLGLALAAALCRKLNGDLVVESDGRTGSCFTATFLCPIAVQGGVSPRPQEIALQGRRILVVDDNPFVRELFVTFLTEYGAFCGREADGLDALQRVETEDFDAIVLDLALPGVEGAEIARQMRLQGRRTRIVGVSAHAGLGERRRALAAGMDVFLVKPVILDELAAALVGPDLSPGTAFEFRGAAALRERLAHQFREELPTQRRALEAALLARDWAKIRSLVHHLKNSGAAVADDILYGSCTAVEAAAAADDGPGVELRWVRLRQALDRWQSRSSLSRITPTREFLEQN